MENLIDECDGNGGARVNAENLDGRNAGDCAHAKGERVSECGDQHGDGRIAHCLAHASGHSRGAIGAADGGNHQEHVVHTHR